MDSLFNYFSSSNWIYAALAIIGISLVISLVFTLLVSIKLRATKGFFITSILMPVVVASIISMMSIFLNSAENNIMRIVTIAVALGLIRFRSTNGRAEELLILFAGIAFGLIAGLGYVVVAAIVAIVIAVIYILLAQVNLFGKKRFGKEKLLKITIPETLEYSEVFNETFAHYLKNYELVEVKTTGMGSMFRLSYRIEMKDVKEEKELIDELRTRNGNLEISVLPYVDEGKVLQEDKI